LRRLLTTVVKQSTLLISVDGIICLQLVNLARHVIVSANYRWWTSRAALMFTVDKFLRDTSNLMANQVDETGVAVYFIASMLRGIVAVGVAITVQVLDAADALYVNVMAEHVFFGFRFSNDDDINRRKSSWGSCRSCSNSSSCSNGRSGAFRSTT